MEVIPLGGALGAEIRGLDLSGPLGGDDVAAVERAWDAHIVLVFRGQTLDERQQIAFAARFGEVAARSRPPERRPEGADYNDAVMMVSNARENGRYVGSLPDGEMWFHHDMCYDPAPSRGTFLHALELPSRGGDTLFANMYAAHDALPAGVRERLRGLRALQVYDYAMRERVDLSGGVAGYRHHVQPVTITHPRTGRRALYVNPLMTARIEGMPEDESRELLDELFGFARDPAVVHAHVWEPGDLVMWDNWCSCHARTDFPAGETRTLRRCVIKGRPLHE